MSRIQYTSEQFDYYTQLLLRRWRNALQMREEWSRMSRDERADFIEDWPINNDILMDLEDYVAKHDLSEEQKAQWTGLRGLVGSQAQTLQDMGYRVVVTKESKQRAVA